MLDPDTYSSLRPSARAPLFRPGYQVNLEIEPEKTKGMELAILVLPGWYITLLEHEL
jgi:hypothetical protein